MEEKRFNYIHQAAGDRTCSVIVLLNYLIWQTGYSPLKYQSKKYWQLIDECGGSKHAPIMDIQPALHQLGLTLIDIPVFRTLSNFRAHIVTSLKKGYSISFCLRHRQGHNHFILITDYDSFYESFLVFNASLLYDRVMEYVSWEDLTKRLYVPEQYKDRAPFYNKEEGTGMFAKYCIENTKLLAMKSENLSTPGVVKEIITNPKS